MLSSFWQLIEQAWNLYGKHWRVYVPGVILAFLVAFVTPIFNFLFAPTVVSLYDLPLNAAITYAIILFFLSLVSVYISFVFLRVIYASITRPAVSWSEELLTTLRHFVPAFVVALVIALATVLGLFVIIVPGIILFVFLFFSQYYVLFEGSSIVESIKQGWHLVRGRWFAVASRLLLPLILIGILQLLLDQILQYLLVQQIFTTPAEVTKMILPVIVSGGLRSLVSALFFPWIYGVTILLFLELKRTPHV